MNRTEEEWVHFLDGYRQALIEFEPRGGTLETVFTLRRHGEVVASVLGLGNAVVVAVSDVLRVMPPDAGAAGEARGGRGRE